MAYPLEATLETAISTIELTLVEDKTQVGVREAVMKWREVLKAIDGFGHGYVLAQKTDAQWLAEDLFNGPND